MNCADNCFWLLLDNFIWKWICRLDVEGKKKWLTVLNEKKESIYYPLENINDLFNYVNVIKSSAARFTDRQVQSGRIIQKTPRILDT